MAAETFKLTGGSVTDNHTNIVAALAEHNVASSYNSGVITLTLADLASTTLGTKRFESVVRIAQAAQAKLAYVSAV